MHREETLPKPETDLHAQVRRHTHTQQIPPYASALHRQETRNRTDNDEIENLLKYQPEEIKSLLEVGFEYVCQKDSLIFLRKRK